MNRIVVDSVLTGESTLVDPATGRAPIRIHRYLTVAALVVAFVVLLFQRYFLLSLIVFPPVIAMPWLAAAAIRPTARAIDHAHTAVRSTAHVTCAVGVLALFWALPDLHEASDFLPGAIVIGVSAALLAAVGREPSERRLGLAVAAIGLAQIGAMVVVIWFTPYALALLPAAALMLIGGVAWFAEADASPAVESTLPPAIVRC